MMSVSSHFLSELATAGVRAGGRHHLELALEGPAHRRGGALVYTPAQYTMGSQLLIRDNIPLDNESGRFLLLGSLFLRHLYMEVDVAAQTVLLGRSACAGGTCDTDRSPARHISETPPPISVQRSTRIPPRAHAQKKVGKG